MYKPLTEQEVGEIVERLEATTKGDWWSEPAVDLKDVDRRYYMIATKDLGAEANANHVFVSCVRKDSVAIRKADCKLLTFVSIVPENPQTAEEDQANAEFLASAHQDVPRLLAEREWLLKAVQKAYAKGCRDGKADAQFPAKPPMTMEQLERLLLFGEAPDGKEVTPVGSENPASR